MGIILRQTVKSSIYSYIGVLFGFVTTILLMPKFLSTSEIGVIRQIQSYALFISSFLALGMPQAIIRMFPHFKNAENKNYGILTLISGITSVTAILFVIFFQLFGAQFLQKDFENSPLLEQYFPLIAIFTVATLFYTIIDSYATARRESTIGVFVKDFVLRVFFLLAVFAYIFIDFFEYNQLVYSITFIQFIPIVIIALFLFNKKLLPIGGAISFPSQKIRNEFFTVSAYGWVNILSSVAVISIDTIMIGKYNDSAAVGVYSTVTYFAAIMLIPNKSLSKISTAIVADHFKNNDIQSIKTIYSNTAFSLYLIGLFLFINALFAIPLIFDFLLSPDFYSGIWVLILIGLSNLVKMGTGIKYSIISNSKYYKWSTLFFGGFVIIIAVTNWIFIPTYGIVGAAFASLLATTIFHAVGLIFVKIKLGLSPFDFRFFKITLTASFVAILIYYIPDLNYPLIASIGKITLFSTLFAAYVIWSKISPEINDQLSKYLPRK